MKPVTDVERTLRFYRDGPGLETPGIDEGMIAFELPNLSLFLIGTSQYATYTGVSPAVPAAGGSVPLWELEFNVPVDARPPSVRGG